MGSEARVYSDEETPNGVCSTNYVYNYVYNYAYNYGVTPTVLHQRTSISMVPRSCPLRCPPLAMLTEKVTGPSE